MDLLRLVGEPADRGEPLAQLLRGIGVVEPLGGGEPRLLPVLGVAAVEPDDRELVVGDRGGRRDARGEALRLVHRHVAEAVRPEERQRLARIALAHPGVIAELDREPVVGEQLACPRDQGLVLAGDDEPVRVLEQDRAELPSGPERLERDPEAGEEVVPQLGRQLLGVEAALGQRLGRQQCRNVPGQPLRIGRVRGHRGKGLEAHGEAGRRSLRPERGLLLVGEGVVGGVVLDEREALGVEAEALVRLLRDAFGVPAGGEERRVGPAAGSGLDHRPRHRTIGPRRRPARIVSLRPRGRGRDRGPRPLATAARVPAPRRRRGSPRRRRRRAACGRW